MRFLAIASLFACGQSATSTDASSGDTPTDAPWGGGSGEPAVYPLELVSPRAPGTLPASEEGTPPMPSGHRIFKAYPNLEYNIRAVVIGGAYPYVFSLSDAPAGMTIDPRTGVVRWPDPSGTTVTPTLTVRDAAGTTASAAWTITVTTAGFRFVDSVNGSDANDGTLQSPWASIAKIKLSGVAGEIVYFRTGTYRTTGMAISGSDTWTRVELNGSVQPVQWLAYPGERPVIDNDYVAGVNDGRFIRLSGSATHPVYVDGLEITNTRHMALQFGSGSCHYAVFRRLDIHDIANAIDGANSAGIMTLTSPGFPTWYAAYQDIDFHDNAAGGIKQYSHKKVLWEDNQFRSSGGGPDLKSFTPRFEVRTCHFHDNDGGSGYDGLFGNMAAGTEPTYGEWRFNRLDCGDSPQIWAMDVNQDGAAGEVSIYRNTVKGTVRVRNVEAASTDGPFHFYKNVIINSSSAPEHITLEAVADPSRIDAHDNLTGTPSDGIVDANLDLTPNYADRIGTHGAQIQ